MKASEMTNDELANRLLSRVPLDSSSHDDMREAAARLRTLTILSKAHQRLANDVVDNESRILSKLKVAEDALDKIYKCIDNHRYGVDASLLAKSIIANALAEIREEGGAK